MYVQFWQLCATLHKSKEDIRIIETQSGRKDVINIFHLNQLLIIALPHLLCLLQPNNKLCFFKNKQILVRKQ